MCRGARAVRLNGDQRNGEGETEVTGRLECGAKKLSAVVMLGFYSEKSCSHHHHHVGVKFFLKASCHTFCIEYNNDMKIAFDTVLFKFYR